MNSADEKVLSYKEDIAKDADLLVEQRDKANEDMRFINVDGGMWEDFLEDYDDNRVRLEFDTVSDYINSFVGEWSLNRMGVDYKPDDDFTSDDDAELLSGIYRSDFRDFSGRIALDNAVEEMATCGFGAYAITPQFEDDEDPENDHQRVHFEPIYNAFNTVLYDTTAKRIDKKDARHAHRLYEYTKDAFEMQYPDFEPVSAYVPGGREFNNVTSKNCVYIARRYEVKKTRTKVHVYNNLANGEVEVFTDEEHKLIEDELREMIQQGRYSFVRERYLMRREIYSSLFNGETFIEKPRRIAGKWIPIVPVYGFRAYVDGQEWYRGLVRKLKDAARGFNVQMSQLMEDAASHGGQIPIFMREQIEAADVRSNWADKKNKAFLYVDPVLDGDGNIIASGPIGYDHPGSLDPNAAALLEIIPNYIQSITGGAPQDTIDPDASGKAINALIRQKNIKTQRLNANIETSLIYSGEVYQSIAAEVYSAPRLMRTLGKDGSEGKSMLMKTIADKETGKLVIANNLKGKKFRVYPDTGPQYESERENTVENLKGVLDYLQDNQFAQKYTPAVISMILQNISGVGLDPLKELARRDMLLQGLVEPETEEDQEFLESIQQENNQPDPQTQLIESMAAKEQAEAQEKQASTAQKLADAALKEAKTQETLSDIGISNADAMLHIRQETFGQQAL